MALMRQLLPSANLVRLVGVFWHDTASTSECSCCTDDEAHGYFAPQCLETLKHAIKTITSNGVWVIVAAKARYAAGEAYDGKALADEASRVSDVFHDPALAARYRTLWGFLARELKDMPMIAGLEPMSEPRDKMVSQQVVRGFYEGVCARIAMVDNRMPCVVGPTPFYKVWMLNSSFVLRTTGGRPMENIVYTFDFFDPWDFVTSDKGSLSYPASYPCSVAFRGWVSMFCPGGGDQPVVVDKQWLQALLERNPLRLMREANVPVYANQWGVKRSISEANGRLKYAADVATLFEQAGIHSTLWIWRSYRKSSWGFELVHEDESRRETEDVTLMNTLDAVWRSASVLRLLPMPTIAVPPWAVVSPAEESSSQYDKKPSSASSSSPRAKPASPPSHPPPPPPLPPPPQAVEAMHAGGRDRCAGVVPTRRATVGRYAAVATRARRASRNSRELPAAARARKAVHQVGVRSPRWPRPPCTSSAATAE